MNWNNQMEELNRRIRVMKYGEIIKKAISDWYFEQGIPEPLWYVETDPPWWKDYLRDMNEK
jgi:hypothetical protein